MKRKFNEASIRIFVYVRVCVCVWYSCDTFLNTYRDLCVSAKLHTYIYFSRQRTGNTSRVIITCFGTYRYLLRIKKTARIRRGRGGNKFFVFPRERESRSASDFLLSQRIVARRFARSSLSLLPFTAVHAEER